MAKKKHSHRGKVRTIAQLTRDMYAIWHRAYHKGYKAAVKKLRG